MLAEGVTMKRSGGRAMPETIDGGSCCETVLGSSCAAWIVEAVDAEFRVLQHINHRLKYCDSQRLRAADTRKVTYCQVILRPFDLQCLHQQNYILA
jgi:hypothetical protein